MTCANTFVQKARPIFTSAGIQVRYPFLSREVVAMGMADSQGNREAKAGLKVALARRVPSQMVYRRKSGFVATKHNLFHESPFLEHLSESLRSSVIAGYVDRAKLADLLSALTRRAQLPAQTLNFAWAFTFLDRWLKSWQNA